MISKPALDRAVKEASAGNELIAPAWYGLVRPNKIRVFGTGNDAEVTFDES